MSEATGLLQNISDIARIVHSGRDTQDILDRIAFAVCCNSPWRSSSIMAIDEGRELSVQVAEFNQFASDGRRSKSWKLKMSPTLAVLKSGQPLIIEDALHDPTYIDYWSDAQTQRYRTVVLLPLHACDRSGRPMILSLHSTERLDIADDALTFLSTLANLAGMAIDKGNMLETERLASGHMQVMMNLQRNLMTQAFNESSLEGLLPLCKQYLPGAFLIVDFMTGKISCGGFDDDEVMQRYLANSGWQRLEKLFRSKEAGRFNQRQILQIQIGDVLQDIMLAAEPVLVRDQRIGGLAIVCDGKLDEQSIRAAESVWMVLSIGLLKHHIRLEENRGASSRHLAEVLLGSDVLHGPERDERSPLSRNPYRLMAVQLASGTAPSEASCWAIRRIAEAADEGVLIGSVSDFLVLLLPETARTSDVIRTVAHQVTAELKRMHGQAPLIYEAPACHRDHEYRSAWRKILRLAKWASERNHSGHLRVTDAKAFGVLADLLDHGLAEDFLKTVLGAIHAYDQQSSTPLMPTLASLARNGGRPQSTADEIGVHITTIRYRMDRLKDLFGLDLKDHDLRFQIDLALRLESMMKLGRPNHSETNIVCA
ncbi:purine catabolism regulator [Rhodoligotrophos appendicifer]|uniref:helix-turn-helix domain-containing protein n=1 Tax=Rhodoligotrophos appendicifer TaxID=987056 RepID=UPI001185004A|nr:helix-turn-helix domain-containing protein [Rhodoligotrophos appendicifer]